MSGKNGRYNTEGDEDEGDDMFESILEQEERLARERRERRKRKLAQYNSSISDGGTGNGNSTAGDSFVLEPTTKEKEEVIDDTKLLSSDSLPIKDEWNLLEEEGNIVDVGDDDEDDDSFDMFTSSPTMLINTNNSSGSMKKKKENMTNKTVPKTVTDVVKAARDEDDAANLDDEEGYYKAHIGEVMNLAPMSSSSATSSSTTITTKVDDDYDCSKNNYHQHSYKILSIIGKGVFSTVYKCSHLTQKSNNDNNNNNNNNNVIAVKLIRNNETMAKAAQQEIKILNLLKLNNHNKQNNNNSSNNHNHSNSNKASLSNDQQQYHPHVVHYYSASEFRGHVALLFKHMPYNLRQTLSNFGKNVGIALGAVKSYFQQMLSALIYLQKCGVVHADIKPDNILVSENFSTLQIADFGSAFITTNNNNNNHNNTYEPPTPYLVSRFYRSPEVILGLDNTTFAIDMWSVAATVAELYCGSVLLPGVSNNDMLHQMLTIFQTPFSNKIIRRHVNYFTTHGLTPHFASNQNQNKFQHIRKDKVNPNKQVVDILSQPTIWKHKKDLSQRILQAKSSKDDYGQVLKFIQLLQKSFTLDPQKRLSAKDAISHPFFTSVTTTTAQNNTNNPTSTANNNVSSNK